MFTRCPHCLTAFRVSREQLTHRAGQVRCGACHHPFNAFVHLLPEEEVKKSLYVDEDELFPQEEPVESAPPESVPPESAAPEPHEPPEPPEPPEPEPPEPAPGNEVEIVDVGEPSEVSEISEFIDVGEPSEASEASEISEFSEIGNGMTEVPLSRLIDPIDATLERWEEQTSGASPAETEEEIRQQGLEAGLVAARHVGELPGFSSWSAAPLDGAPSVPNAPGARMPFILAALFFAFLFFIQTGYHFRGELSRGRPGVGNFFQALGIEVPLAREPEYLSIIASDLYPLESPDRLQLLVTLRNRALYPQDWPHLEISLTDAYDEVLIRKVLTPAEYLSREQAVPAFASGDIALKLDLGTRDVSPAGYHLYLFYP